MFSFKVFLLFWVRAAGERAVEKEIYFGKKKIVTLVGFGF